MVQKVDVAIQSYRKPESLVYTCLTLKEFCGQHIDNIWIDDDLSNDNSVSILNNKQFLSAMSPIRINIRVNEKRAGLYYFEKHMFAKRPRNWLLYCYYKMKKRSPSIVTENDIRYQWAINSTDKKYLYITHDDVEFRGDVIGEYLREINKGYLVVGDLGQCWRCNNSSHCNPELICRGEKPNRFWPKTSILNIKHKRDCRINEWSCMIDVDATRILSKNKAIFFGAYEDFADIAAFWFDYIVRKGYRFSDPILNSKDNYYKHCWQGFAGFETDIYGGKNKYDAAMIKELISKRYEIII